jgi:DNA-binding CsgD family transcriptional regulator
MRFTPREDEILRLIACDRSDKEIARTLSMSPHTLRTHLSRLYERHGVHTRAAAVARWLLRTTVSIELLEELALSA